MHFDWFDSAHHKFAQVRLNRTQFKQRGHSLIFLLIGILFLVIVAGGAYYLGKSNTPQPKACTLEAKVCSDGSSVGRVGPNCEFAPCPSPSSTNSAVSPAPNGAGETANWKTYTNSLNKYQVMYPSTLVAKNDLGAGNNLNNTIFDYPPGPGVDMPPYYISVITFSLGTTQNPNVYNSLSKPVLDKIFALKVNEETDRKTTIEIGGSWNYPTNYKRLADAIINGEGFLVIENPKWYGDSDRRLLINRDDKIYMIGTTYQTVDQLKTFQNLYSTFKFL